MARNGGVCPRAADARGARLRPDRTGVFLDLAGRCSRARDWQARRRRQERQRPFRAHRDGRPDLVPGRRLHVRDLSEAAAGGVAGLLDRRRLDTAHGRRCRHHPGSGEPRRHRPRTRARRPELHRRQLHGQPDAHGDDGAVPRGPRRVDDVDDLPGGVRRRRAADARADRADGARARVGADAARRSRVRPFSTSIATVVETLRARDFPDARTSAIRSPAACCPGSTRISATARAAKSGRARPRATRFSGERRIRSLSTASASASARCAATARG